MARHAYRSGLLAMACIFSGAAHSAVTAEEAKALGNTLTQFGAEAAGNKDGMIPAYGGEGLKAPGGWNSKDPGQRPDPFNDKPLFSITAQNVGQYSERLSDGQKELFKKYPGYRMDVYPSHRTMFYPKYVLDNTVKNVSSCKEAGATLVGCYGGLPFPIPKTGTEVMWNHAMHFESYHIWIRQRSFVVPTSGAPVLVGDSEGIDQQEYYDPNNKQPNGPQVAYLKVRLDSIAPARQNGEKLVLIDYVDQTRRVWQYIPGQRRVKLAPDLAYDTPSPYSGGSSTMDDAKIFGGSLDRYDWKLTGKTETYIPYNTFNLTNQTACTEEKILGTKNYPNPDCVRWELHRTWVVKATLKPAFRHIYKTRTFYWDEDTYAGGFAENYDQSGKLYRITWGAVYPFWVTEGGGVNNSFTFWLDLQTGIYSTQASSALKGTGAAPTTQVMSATDYRAEALGGSGVR